eukprot:Skav212681  [mRNA]  locus=scaffold1930:51149:52066:+ [translate_table: standard]
MVLRGVVWLVGVVLAADPPSGCPSSLWKTACSATATCESLALAGLTCSSVALIENCKDVCAQPCCITTTTTTRTSTRTSVTHTETTVTVTSTETHTSISRTTTGTMTMTTTTTATTVTTATQTYTESTVTHTHTDTTMTSTATETEVMTTAVGAATKVTVTMAVKVEENAERYIEDSRVKQAYADLMQEITGLDAKMIDVDMTPGEESEIAVTYLLTVPWEDHGNGMVPVVSSESLMSKLRLAEQDLAGLNEKLDQKMEAAGVTDFSQEVQKVDDDLITAINGALRCSLPMVTSFVLYFSGQLPS